MRYWSLETPMGRATVAAHIVSAVLLSLLIVTAGCTTFLTPETESTSTATPVEAGPLPTVKTPVETTRCHCVRNGRFELHDMYAGPVSVTIYKLTNGEEVVAEGVFTEQFEIQSFDSVMRYGTDYRVVIRVDGEYAWSEEVPRHRGYEVLVRENGTVEVIGGVIV